MLSPRVEFAFCSNKCIAIIDGNSEKEWEAEANSELAHCGLKLGDYHRLPVAIEGDIYDDGWYELQTI